MIEQHRSGYPSRVRNDDNLRWADTTPSMNLMDWLLIGMIGVALGCLVMGCTVWAPVGGTF